MALGSIISAQTRGSVLDSIAHPNVLDPAAAYTKAAGAAANIWDVRQKQAAQAAGEAYQNAIDPQSGAFDPNKFRANLAAAGPSAAMAAGTSLANVQNISYNELQQAKDRSEALDASLSGLLSKPGGATPQDVFTAAGDLVHRGLFTPAQAGAALSDMPMDPQHPELLQPWLQQHMWRNIAANPAVWSDTTELQIGGGQTIQVPRGIGASMLLNNPQLQRLNPNFGQPRTGAGAGNVTNESFGPNAGR